jgi:hypothetical protein
MGRWSDFHHRYRPKRRGLGALPREMIGKEFAYRDFLLRRANPQHPNLWTICDPAGGMVRGLDGAFTNSRLAERAVDRHIIDNQRKETNPSRCKNKIEQFITP